LVSKLIIKTVVWNVFQAALLFVAAGTVQWPAGWVFMAEMGGLGLAVGLWLAHHDPALLAERMSAGFQATQKTWDKVFMATLFVLWNGWLVLMAFDAVRFRWSQVPIWVQAVGAVLIALCMYVFYLTFRENTYAAPVVKIQAERGHQVVTTGPYALVRHPMYAGAVLLFIGIPLLLGSWYGLAAVLVMVALLVVRIVMEERTLTNELAGYREYAARVRWRLAPGIW
jgi:protein-S-isoprenylcysteine O-methyltransferase Ste14